VTSWRHSITLRLSLAFALLATLVFAALGIYLGRSADAHMAELDAHELLGKLVLVRNVGTRESSPEALAARLGDALVGEHGVMVAVDGEKGAIFRWPANGPAASLVTATGNVGETPVRLALDGRDFRVVAETVQTAGENRYASSSPATSATTRIFSTNCSVISGWRWSRPLY